MIRMVTMIGRFRLNRTITMIRMIRTIIWF